MLCLKCSGKSKVYSTINHGATIERLRVCRMCGDKWRTFEEITNTPVRVRKQHKDVRV